MKNFIAYLDNGKIIKTGYCQFSDFYLQGPNVIEGIANDSTQYIKDGFIVNMPLKPNGEAYFDFDNKQWVLNPLIQKEIIKKERNFLLQKSDWSQLSDVPLTTKTQWADYRQELRDITLQSGYPFNVIWPTPPQG